MYLNIERVKKKEEMINKKDDSAKNAKDKCRDWKCGGCGGCGGAFYGLGFLGALVYYLSTASGFWMGVLGVLKAIVWPAFLIYELLKYLGM